MSSVAVRSRLRATEPAVALIGVVLALLAAAASTVAPLLLVAIVGLLAIAAAIAQPLAFMWLGVVVVPLEGYSVGLLGPSQVAVGLGAVGWIIRWAARATEGLPRDSVVIAFAVLIAANIGGLLVAPEPLVASRQVITWGALFLVVAALALTANRTVIERFAFAFVLCGGLAGLVAVVDPQPISASVYGGDDLSRATGGLGSPNALGMLLALTLPIQAVFALRGTGTQRVVAAGCAALALLGMTLAVSRGAFLGLATAVLVLAFWAPFRRTMLLAVPLVLVLAVVGQNPDSPIGGQIVERLTDPSTSGTTNPRIALWEAAPGMIAERPIFGMGGLQYAHYAPSYGLAGIDGVSTHAHNLFITVTVETGIVGLAGILGLLAGMVACLRRTIRQAPEPAVALAFGFAAALAGFMVNGMFDYGLSAAPLAAVFFTLAGCIAGLARATSDPPKAMTT